MLSRRCQNNVFWNVKPCSLVEMYQMLRGSIAFICPNKDAARLSKSLANIC
jgi:hypothetical protein